MDRARTDFDQCDLSSRVEVRTFVEPSTKTWQYVVIEPHGIHCVIVDPVLEHTDEQPRVSTTAADELLDFIKQRQLQVDAIFETCSQSETTRSAAWYLRMQLLVSQGYAPRICGSRATAPFNRLFSRKYGKNFRDTLENDYADGEAMAVGSMSISIVSLPGLSSPDGRAYLVEDNIFGAQPVVELQSKLEQAMKDCCYDWDSSERYHQAWLSMQKILGLPAHTRIYLSSADTGTAGEVTARRRRRPFSTVQECMPEAETVQSMADDTRALLGDTQ